MAKQKPARTKRFHPSLTQLGTTFDGLRRLPNVWGCYVGTKTVGGKNTGEPSIVCVVGRKVSKKHLSSAEWVPSSHEWSIGGRRKARLATDVVQAIPKFSAHAGGQPVAGPGDSVLRAGGAAGTVGLVVRRGSTTYITTAGHVFSGAAPGEVARLRNAGSAPVQTSVSLAEIRSTRRTDCALLATTVPAQNLYLDRDQILSAYMPNPGDLDTQLWVAKAAGKEAVRCRGLYGTFTLPNGAVIENVILTDFATVPGDSGCPLVDRQGRVWGLLRGGLFSRTNPVSIFATALDLFIEMQVELS
jgi:S1-C subfamily serine protease